MNICQWKMSEETVTEPVKFQCEIGMGGNGYSFTVWIKSPRTGDKIEIGDGWWRDLPEGVLSRIKFACGMGKNTADFTRDELLAFVALESKIQQHCSGADQVPVFHQPGFVQSRFSRRGVKF